MPKFDFYSIWMDPVFYGWAAAFAAALFALVYSIRRYLELKNGADFIEEDPAPADEPHTEDIPTEQPELPVLETPRPAVVEGSPSSGPAENFVRGIYEGISGVDARLKAIENYLAKGHVNGDFTVKFLEDIIQDMDSLDKGKIKARIEYLLSDLKK